MIHNSTVEGVSPECFDFKPHTFADSGRLIEVACGPRLDITDSFVPVVGKGTYQAPGYQEPGADYLQSFEQWRFALQDGALFRGVLLGFPRLEAGPHRTIMSIHIGEENA